jgi:hypothetical protein
MSREAMELALEALESDPITHAGLVSRKQAITALRQALVDADDTLQKRVDVKAKDRHEPVAWASSLDFDDDAQEIIPAKDKGKLGTSNCDIPLYTAPQKAEQEPVAWMHNVKSEQGGRNEWRSQPIPER